MSGPHSQLGGVVVRLVFAVAGALALGLALLTICIYAGWLLQPDNPEGAQLGSLGFVIGLPLGFVLGYSLAPQKHLRLVFLAASVGASVGGLLGGYAATIIGPIAQHLSLAPPDADSGGGRARSVIGLLFTFAGCGGGWFFAHWWTRLRKGDKDNTAPDPKA